MRLKHTILPFILLALLFVSACEEEKVEPDQGNNSDQQTDEKPLNRAFYALMQEWYLWNKEIPDIDPQNFEDPSAILEEIRYNKDDWSYISTYESFQQYYQEGAYIGYGFGYKWDSTDSLRVTFVFEDSPFAVKDISRSWTITKINGSSITPSNNLSEMLGANEVGVKNRFELKSPDGKIVDTTFAKKDIDMNTVLQDTVLNVDNKKIGYMVLKSFISKTPGEIADAFKEFGKENIDEVIVDLRYNGGGQLGGSKFLGEFIINDQDENKTFVKLMHNDKKDEENDVEYTFEEDSLALSLGLDRVYFITTQATASASEALINGLKPYMDVYTIGAQTYGKPVGMYAFIDNNDEYVFLPVSFRVANANGNSDYYQGLPVDVEAKDDITEPFGSLQEESLHQVLYHIRNGSFDMTKAGFQPIPENKVEYKSMRDEIGAL